MIHLYFKDNENYEKNGDVILQPVRCETTAGINRTWQIDLEHPIDDEGRWKYIVADNVIKCPSFNGEQLWRIVQTEKRDTGIFATCDPIFYDAAHEVVVIDRITLNNTTPEAAFNAIAENSKYTIRTDITESASVWYQRENLVAIITGAEHGFAHTWSAEIGFNNYEVQVMHELGGDYGASVLYGKNMAVDGISEKYNIDGTITRIIPVAYNGYTLPEMYVDSDLIGNYPFPRVGIISYDNLRLWEDKQEGEEGNADTEYFNSLEELYAAMRARAREEYTVNEVDKPTIGLEVDMVLIQNTEEYKDYKDLETVSIGDYVRCYNPRLNIDSKTRVRSIQYDCIRESVTYVELGREKRNYFDNVTSIMSAAGKAIRPNGTIIAEQVQGFIDGAMAQLRLQNTIAKKQDVRAILFEDLDPESPTYGAMCLGTQGFQISKQRTADGRDWVWTTSATAAGLIANTIVTGLLSDKAGRNHWNLDTGAFSLQGVAISDASIDGYATDGELNTLRNYTNGEIGNLRNDTNQALALLQATVNDAIEDLQDQIDGKVDTWFYEGAPALNKPPVTYDGSDPDTGWDTTEKKEAHIGDLYYDTLTGYAYRFYREGNVFSWLELADSDVAEALELARQAQRTADSKMQVFITQPVPPYERGDLWLDGDTINVCITSRATGTMQQSDWQRRDTYASLSELAGVDQKADEAYTRATAIYGTSQTASETGRKIVEINSPVRDLYAGMRISVFFTKRNTHPAPSIQLKYNGVNIGSYKDIRVNPSTQWQNAIYGWSDNSMNSFVYNGSYWLLETTDQMETFNRLTNGGAIQGIYMENSNLYINGTYIKAGTIEGITIRGNDLVGNNIQGGSISGATIMSNYSNGNLGAKVTGGLIEIYLGDTDSTLVGTLRGLYYGEEVGSGPILSCEKNSIVGLGSKVEGRSAPLPAIAYQASNNVSYLGTFNTDVSPPVQKGHFVANEKSSYIYGYDSLNTITRYLYVDGPNNAMYLNAPDDKGYVYLSDILRVKKSSNVDMLQVLANGSWRDGYDYDVTIGNKTLRFASGILFEVR